MMINTTTGIIIIGLVFLAFWWFTNPKKEDPEKSNPEK